MTGRQRLLAFGAWVVVLVVVGQAVVTPPSGTGPLATAPASDEPIDLTPRIAVVYDVGGPGSNLSESASEGARRAAERFGATFEAFTGTPGDTDAAREQRVRLLADRYSPIFVIGSVYAGPVARVAPEHRNTWFGVIGDGTVNARNVVGIRFHDEQGAFLVGAAAALTSTTGILGFIGARELALPLTFEAGFVAGARAVDPKVEVRVAYPETAKAKETALGMYDADVDVILAVAGEASADVAQAAHDRGRWVIGAEIDLYLASDPSVRDSVLTSMVTRADVATYTIAAEVANNIVKDGTHILGVGLDAVGYSTSGGFVDPLKAQLDAFAARIAAGEILVPTKPS